jgi:hypothetical protein
VQVETAADRLVDLRSAGLAAGGAGLFAEQHPADGGGAWF